MLLMLRGTSIFHAPASGRPKGAWAHGGLEGHVLQIQSRAIDSGISLRSALVGGNFPTADTPVAVFFIIIIGAGGSVTTAMCQG